MAASESVVAQGLGFTGWEDVKNGSSLPSKQEHMLTKQERPSSLLETA